MLLEHIKIFFQKKKLGFKHIILLNHVNHFDNDSPVKQVWQSDYNQFWHCKSVFMHHEDIWQQNYRQRFGCFFLSNLFL